MSGRVVGAVALGVGAVLAVCGSLLELYRIEFGFEPGRTDRQVFTGWQSSFDFTGMAQPENMPGLGWGYPIVAAAALAVVSVVLLFRSPLLGAVGRVLAVLAGGLLIGTTCSAFLTLERLLGPTAVAYGTTTVGAGLWVLVLACLAVAAGAVLVQEWPRRQPKPAGPAVYRVDGDDEDTPPFGIPIPTDEIDVDGKGESPERG
ncbi:hypothetical protein [Saccharothrix sp.]|uniref:hypothetical protein n=1 Tax=Saccharothrix sp. TaxID=1873460 RepID=UPI002810DBDC|nr:hypothetical protein [Saccharothrix sp.]